LRTLRSAVFGAILIAAVGSIPATAAHAADGFAEASLSPTSLVFGQVNIGHSTSQTVTVTSTGATPLTPGAVSLTGTSAAAFSVTANTCTGATLATGQTCTIRVTANPVTAGALTATLNVVANTAAGSLTADVTGTSVIEGGGTYFPVSPARILDTRTGNGVTKGIVGKGGTVHLQVTGRGGVPSTGVSAVVLNLTVTGTTGPGFLTAFPSGASVRPTASSLNFAKGWTRSNSVTVQVGSGGKVDIYASASTHIIADVSGWYGANGLSSVGGQLQAVEPYRKFDSRSDWGAPLHSDEWGQFAFNFGADFNSHLRAVIVNITAIGGPKGGFLTAWNGDPNNIPSTSTVNYLAKEITPNLAVVPVGPCYLCDPGYTDLPSITVLTLQDTNFIIDVVGLIDDGTVSDGLRFTPAAPQRIVDSRIGQGLPANLGTAQTGAVTVPAQVAPAGTQALALNITGVTPTAATYLTAWPSDLPKPEVSNLNLAKGQVAANQGLTFLAGGQFNLYNNNGTTGVVIDAVGSYWLYPGTAGSLGVIAVQGIRGGSGHELFEKGAPAAVQHKA